MATAGTKPATNFAASAKENPAGDFFFVGDIEEVAVYGKVLPGDRVVAEPGPGQLS